MKVLEFRDSCKSDDDVFKHVKVVSVEVDVLEVRESGEVLWEFT